MTDRFATQPPSPFTRLTRLLDGVAPGADPINLHIGEPQRPVPAFVAEAIVREAGRFGKYPPVAGSDALRLSIAAWLRRRYGLPEAAVDPDRNVLPLVGTREGLFLALFTVAPERKGGARPAVLIPNPFYQCYAAAAAAAGCDAVYVNATPETGFLPDFGALDEATLARTAAVYVCSPSNPEGAAAGSSWWRSLFALAGRHGFAILADECYSEIYDREPPIGALQAAQESGRGFERLLAFHSLSKRSGLPGLRSGFVAGDAALIAAYRELRNYAGPTMPGPLQAASAAAWADEAHVEENRAHYRANFDLADRILRNRFGYRRPAGGFFLWLETGGTEEACTRLWREAGLRTLPGLYLAREAVPGDPDSNPGRGFLRVALVQDADTTEAALTRLAATL
jgi:N-succinyldiaminopimelate aminotransferase